MSYMAINASFFIRSFNNFTKIIPSKFGRNQYNKDSVIRRKDGELKWMITDHNNSGEITSNPWERAIVDPRVVI